jgi:hypothetical protein
MLLGVPVPAAAAGLGEPTLGTAWRSRAARAAEPTLGTDSTGRVTLRADRLQAPLELDGRLEEAIYGDIPARTCSSSRIRRRARRRPKDGGLVFFDDDNVYVSVRCWDTHPEREIANELRRDGQGINQGENIALVFDTFLDRRNGFYFQTNPLGVLRDQEIRDEGNQNPDWNAVWDVKAGKFDQGGRSRW